MLNLFYLIKNKFHYAFIMFTLINIIYLNKYQLSYYLINNIKKELFTNVDLKNGTAYISFRDWVNIFSRETGYEFFWDSDKQTVFFRTK